MALVFMIGILILGLGIIFYNSYKSIYAWSDHCGWEPNSKPDKNAQIRNIASEKVRYGSSSTYVKLKTKITFSDGFYFITHKTDYNHTGLCTYQVYLSDELREKVIGLAIEQHNLAVDKFINNNQSVSCKYTIDTKTKKDITKIKIEIVNDEKYINLKSNDRIEYLNNQKKQTVSELDKLNKMVEVENNKIKDIPVDIAKYIKPDNTSSLKNDILNLENKILALDELIELEMDDKNKKTEYEVLTKKLTAKTQSDKVEKVSVGTHTNTEDEEDNGWQYWD